MISDGNISYPFFWMEKNKVDKLGKKQGSYSKTSFPFSLKTVEKQSNIGKSRTTLLLLWNDRKFFIIFLGSF